MVDCDRFRQEQDKTTGLLTSISQKLLRTLINGHNRYTFKAVKQATREIPEEAGLEAADSKLLHLWEARSSLQRRWRRQRLNRALRRRIARLGREIGGHANRLDRQQWESTCNSTEGQLGLGKTWNFLRCLLDPEGSKTTQRQNLNKITHTYAGTDDELIRDIRNRYRGSITREPQIAYTGRENPAMDEEITEAEVRAEILRLPTKSAPRARMALRTRFSKT